MKMTLSKRAGFNVWVMWREWRMTAWQKRPFIKIREKRIGEEKEKVEKENEVKKS